MTVLTLENAVDERLCGRKAAALATLRRQGFDVPDGFVIPAGAQPARADIEAALALLGNGPVAVRSSGLAEDTADASFAGQYDTMLNVQGADAVLDAVAAIVRSAHSSRVASYASASQPMAVLVQRMVPSDVSGVAFSANPLTGNRSEVRITATKGLGDRLVSGEIDGDEWLVSTAATAVSQPQQAIDAATAMKIAALARKAESARKAPQDIEWAMADGRLYLLQSRPITVLPIAPQIDKPKGTWQKDAGHFSEPVSPFTASTQLRHGDRILDEGIAKWGLLPDRATFRIIGHEPYIHIDPDDGGKQPPPWWVLGAVVRIIPSLRRKLRASAAAIDSGMLESVPAEWASQHRPRLDRQIREYATLNLIALDDDALFAHLNTLSDFYTECLSLHFYLAIPYAVGVRELAVACEELLGWDLAKSMSLLQGLSETSRAGTDELAAIAKQTRPGSAARQILESKTPDFLDRLDPIDPSIAGQLRDYLGFWGLRPLGSEVGCPMVAEQPQLVADAIADLLSTGAVTDFTAARTTLRDEARAKLTGDALQRFNAVLAYAERVYALREDNVVLTDQLPIGLLRRVALEIGRRMVSKGQMARIEDAVMLTSDELRDALRADRDVRPLVSLRKSEHAWVRANPGPMTYGPEPGKSPDLRGLPEAARRINSALMWLLESELTHPPKNEDDAISGIAASPGVHRGRVRVITTPDKLHTLKQGEVLVCPFTSAAWVMVFRRAGAIVADTGSVLSHTAIVAREFALPAVVATANGTARLKDGEEVIVDGTRGIVTRC